MWKGVKRERECWKTYRRKGNEKAKGNGRRNIKKKLQIVRERKENKWNLEVVLVVYEEEEEFKEKERKKERKKEREGG